MKTKHYLEVILKAVEKGLEINLSDSVEEVYSQAEEAILDCEPFGHKFIQCNLTSHGISQHYLFIDEDGYETDCTGNIFDYPNAKAYAEVYFKKEDENFSPVDWFEIPDEDNPECKNYVFVFDKVVCRNGIVAYLYDYLRKEI